MSLIRILIADDLAEWRRLVASLLRQETSFEIVCEVSDGLCAVQMAERLQPNVVLLDIGLPKLNGIEAGGWIRKLAPKAKIVFVSEYSNVDFVKAALHIGSAYVLKSDGRELISAIHCAVRGEKYVSRQLAGFRLLQPEH